MEGCGVVFIILGMILSFVIALTCAVVWLVGSWPWYVFIKDKKMQELQNAYQIAEGLLLESLRKFNIENPFQGQSWPSKATLEKYSREQYRKPPPPLPISMKIKQQVEFRYRHLYHLAHLDLEQVMRGSLVKLSEDLNEIKQRINAVEIARQRIDELQERTIAKDFSRAIKKYSFIDLS